MLDEEASEIEIHRILRNLNEDDPVRTSVLAWQQIRAVARNDFLLSKKRHLELMDRIRAEIGAHEPVQGKPTPKPASYRKPLTGMAIAASLVLAVFAGMQIQLQLNQQVGPGQEMASGKMESPLIQQRQEVPVQFVSSDNRITSHEKELIELDEEKQRQVRAWLRRHEQMTRLNPNVRTVIYDPQEAK